MKGYNKMFWGMFFSVFHINLGNLEILPSFVGILILASGIKEVNETYKNKHFENALKYVYIEALLYFIAFIFPILGVGGIYEDTIFNIIWVNVVIVIDMIFTIKLLERSSDILTEKHYDDEGLNYKNKSRNFIVLSTIGIILNNINYIFMLDTMTFIIPIYLIIIKVWIMFSFKRLSKNKFDKVV